MTSDEVPTTDDSVSIQPPNSGRENSDPQAVIARWISANCRAEPPRPSRLAQKRSFLVVVAIFGILAFAATFVLLGNAGKPQMIHNPHVQR